MKYYKALSSLKVFNHNEAEKIIGSKIATSKYLGSMVSNGYITRIKKNLYTCIDLSSNTEIGNRFTIASKITDDSYIAYHTAFEFYAVYNQIFYKTQVCSSKRFQEFTFDDYTYTHFKSNSNHQIDLIQGVKVTSIERTIIDSINMLGKVMDTEELIKCLNLVSFVDEIKLIEMLEIYDKEILYRKTGYILSNYKEIFNLTDNFFEICKFKGKPSNKGSISYNEINELEYNSEWGIYCYKDITKLTNKGGTEDV